MGAFNCVFMKLQYFHHLFLERIKYVRFASEYQLAVI